MFDDDWVWIEDKIVTKSWLSEEYLELLQIFEPIKELYTCYEITKPLKDDNNPVLRMQLS